MHALVALCINQHKKFEIWSAQLYQFQIYDWGKI